MTILPKKKPSKEKSEAGEDPQHSPPHQGSASGQGSSRGGPSPPARWGSPPPQVDHLREERVLPNHVDPGGIFEEYSTHEGASNKRRHRSSPHRNVRKHRHDRHERSTQWDSSASAPSVAASSSTHLHPSFRPVASTSEDQSSNVEQLNTEEAEEDFGGYNSEDEYNMPANLTEDIEELERCFEEALKEKRGFIIKRMGEDGACLFRAVADQIYGDQEMHGSVRGHCVDYMAKNKDFFKAYVTEDFNLYLSRKRLDNCHGNNVEMQAICELYNRPVEVYQYSTDPINTFQTTYKSEYEPIRLSYHRNMHYNSVVNPRKATIGVGLGLPNFQPGLAEKNLMLDAKRISEDFHIEKTMLEDKLRETDWEVTQETLEEQVARESYLQWLRDQEKASNRPQSSASATCSTASEGAQGQWWEEAGARAAHSPRSHASNSQQPSSSQVAMKPSQSEETSQKEPSQNSQMPGSLSPGLQQPSCSSARSPHHHPDGAVASSSTQAPFAPTFAETTSIMNELPPELYGFADWGEDEIMAQVMAQSQREYLDSLKKRSSPKPQSPQQHTSHHGNQSPGPSTS